jgi:aminoglycoside phosphotransferase (APT) family kinase protein
MTDAVLNGTAVICDEQLHTALHRLLADHFGREREIVSLSRRLAPYRASFHLEEVDLRLDGGTRLDLVFKDLGQQLETARRVKPQFLYNPRREIDAYRAILAHERLGTPICYGTVVEPCDSQYWLFIERIEGTRLRELGEFSTWELAARWVAALHVEYAPQANQLQGQTHLLKYDREYMALWIERARQVSGIDPTTVGQIEWLAQRYDAIVERLATLPVTLIHGEFYPSNIMVRNTASGVSLSPVDWEMAALGPGLLDLAAITSGSWSKRKAVALARAYYDVARHAYTEIRSFKQFMYALDCCRLYHAVQWLGWSAEWVPPPEHTHDWMNAALQLAEHLGLGAAPATTGANQASDRGRRGGTARSGGDARIRGGRRSRGVPDAT